MARILVIYKQFPAPSVGHAGGESLYGLMEALRAHGHELALVARIRDEELPQLETVRALCSRVDTVPHHRSLGGPRLLAFARSYGMLRRAAIRALRDVRPDLVHIETTQTAVALLGVRLPPSSFRTQDVNWFLWEQQAASQQGLRRRLTLLLAALARRAEPWLYRRHALLLAISEGDRRLLAPHCAPRPLLVIPLAPGVHDDPAIPPAVPPGPNVLFVGAMSRAYNVAGVTWFLDQVWPQVLAQVPEARFYIVGKDPPAALQTRHDGTHVFVVGFVDTLEPWYRAAAVCISPLLVAGGLLQKVIDALTMGAPVVATSVSNHGIGATPGEHLLVADTPTAFAEAVTRLLQDVALREHLGAAGRLFVEAHYAPGPAMARWDAALRRLLPLQNP